MFKFSHPAYLHLLYVVPIMVLIFIFFFRSKIAALKKFADIGLHTSLFGNKSYWKDAVKFGFWQLAFILVILSLAGPQIGSKMEDVKQMGIDIYICLDVSASMNARDLLPSRLEKAKNDISMLMKRLKGDRVGLIVFAGESFVQFPLTSDYSAANLFLKAVDLNSVPSQGTAIASSINLAIKSFDQNSKTNRAIIVVTDGEDHEGDLDGALDNAKDNQISIYTIGLGSVQGTAIPITDDAGNEIGQKRDKQGEIIKTKLNEEVLQKIASKGGGVYIHSQDSENSLSKVYENLSKIEKTEFGSRRISEYDDKYYLFLIPAFLILVAELFFNDKKSLLLAKLFESKGSN